MRTTFLSGIFLCLTCFFLSVHSVNAEEVKTKYFTVTTTEEWKVVMPPNQGQSMVNAVFANSESGATVSIVVGPSSGADLKTITDMFASQFGASKPARKKGELYTFHFEQQDMHCEAWVGSNDNIFIVTTFTKRHAEGLHFIKEHLSSPYKDLFPR